MCVHACVHLLTFSSKNFSETIDWAFTVDSAYLQVVFVTENIAIKRSARSPESSI